MKAFKNYFIDISNNPLKTFPGELKSIHKCKQSPFLRRSGNYTYGNENMLRMDYLPSSAIIRNNEQVVTSGSTMYPRDLILGYIIDAGFNDTGVAKYAVLDPAAEIETLEQVFVLTSYNVG